MKKILNDSKGMTLVELLISAFLASLIVAAGLEFYTKQHNVWLTQQEVSNMQQNGRVSMDELIYRIRLAGAGLPEGIPPVEGRDSNPDTIIIRYINHQRCAVNVGKHSNNQQGVPIHVDRELNLSCFFVGQAVNIYRAPSGPGEWFTITNLSDNPGSGWKEVYHGGQDLQQDPMPGDVILALSEVRYYIDQSDSLHPKLVRWMPGIGSQDYAEDIEDLEFVYTLSDGTTSSAPALGDTVRQISITLRAKTQNKDTEFAFNQGYRQRDYSSAVYLRNSLR